MAIPESFTKEFKNPGNRFRGKPFWAWNGELKEEELHRQAGILREMGFGGFFMHSRSGLITEYLGQEWFDLINSTADCGEKLGMESWLYDEDRWPSGSAGGKVTVDPKYRMKSLHLTQIPVERFSWDENIFLCYLADIDGLVLYRFGEIGKETDLSSLSDPIGKWYVLRFTIEPDAPHSNFNGTTYIDTMSEEAVDRFIGLTHEEYASRCGDRIGRSVKGIFSDEPHRGHGMDNREEKDGIVSCDICYTDDFFEQFYAAYGYDAKDQLPCLFYQPQGKRIVPIKLHYFDLACNLFNERFTARIHRWCQNHGILYTGHALHEDGLDQQTAQNGSLMRFYEHEDIPGVDVLCENNRSYWVVKQAESAARQFGKPQVLSELYGCTGWQFGFRSHKAVGDWQTLLGVNFRCHHLSWYTMEGEAKRDYPASILHQSAWWKEYSYVETYFARFAHFMSAGTPACDLLVLNPIESVWCQTYLGWSKWLFSSDPEIAKLNEHYFTLFGYLMGNHIDFDYGEEQIMRDHASVGNDAEGRPVLRVGMQEYHTVIVSGLLTIRPSTVTLLRDFLQIGGHVIFAGDVPAYIDAVESEIPAKLASFSECVPFEENALIGAVRKSGVIGASLTDQDGNEAKNVFLQMRRTSFGTLCALVNLDRENETGKLTLTVPCKDGWYCEEWNPEDGTRTRDEKNLFFSAGKAQLTLTLPAEGSGLYRFCSDRDEEVEEKRTVSYLEDRQTDLKFTYSLSEPNVCVLDFASCSIDGSPFGKEDEVLRIDDRIRDHFGLERRGGEMVQPWYSKLHDGKVLGRVKVRYFFEIERMPEGDVFLAGERPEQNRYSLNGFSLKPLPGGEFWVDSAFVKMKVPKEQLHLGRNEIVVSYEFRKTSAVEAIYLLGQFGVSHEGKKRTLISLPPLLPFSGLENTQIPFYSGEITWTIPREVTEELTAGNKRTFMKLDAIDGAAVRISVGSEEKLIAWEPYIADITDGLLEDKEIRITLYPTRKNTFGPLHQIPAVTGATGPFNFRTRGDAFTENASLIPVGIRGIHFLSAE